MIAGDQVNVLYFGCRHELGHFLWYPDGHKSLHVPDVLPWMMSELDGGLQPPLRQGAEARKRLSGDGYFDGQAVRHVRQGWAAVAYWDRTIDHRPGSCSVLLTRGEHSTGEVVALVKAAFPDCVRCRVVEVAELILP